MAQLAQTALGRNTSVERPKKARNWCFTLNNYDEKDIQRIKASDSMFIFQEETGTNGTKHLQGVLSFKNAISFLSIKKLIPRAHIEVCKKLIASINYCKKGETRTGNVYTNVDSWLGTEKKKVEEPFKITDLDREKMIHDGILHSMGATFCPPSYYCGFCNNGDINPCPD